MLSSNNNSVDGNLFTDVASTDVLSFGFGGRSYADQLRDAVAKTSKVAAVEVSVKSLPVDGKITKEIKAVWAAHDFGFLGGSLGCAEGEKITRALEKALTDQIPAVLLCRTGGARYHCHFVLNHHHYHNYHHYHHYHHYHNYHYYHYYHYQGCKKGLYH